jgi:hypothetical protein
MADELDQARRNVLERFPLLNGHDWSIVDSRSTKPDDERQLEFYSPDEPDSPTPGRPTLEIFNPNLRGEALEHAIYGDMLHHLPTVDRTWSAMRDKLRQSLTPDQQAMDRRAYERDQRTYGEDRPYDEWHNASRLDAYIRGRLSPDANDDWRDVYTPDQHNLLNQMEDHLQLGRRYQEGGQVTDDPEALEREVDRATQFVPLERAYTGLGERSNNADVVDRLQHPTYEQLAADKDLRRGRTRMAPRGLGNEGGFGYQEGGRVPPALRPPVVVPEGRMPVPRVRGNLPSAVASDEVRGREVPPVRPMEWYERANPRSEGGGSLKQGPWENPPLPPEGFPSRDLSDMAALHRTNPEFYSDPAVRLPQYQQGGPVRRRQEGRVEGEFDPPQGEESDAYTPEAVEQIEKDLREGKGGTMAVMPDDYPFEDQPGRPTDLPEQPRIRRYEHGGQVDSAKIGKLMDDPEHGTWHHDGKFHVYTPHPSFFIHADPRHLVQHFDKHHPEDHKLNLE